MTFRPVKCLLVAVFSLFFTTVFSHDGKARESKKLFDANEVIFGHIMDAHEFHFLSYKGSDGKEHHATIPLPVILYSSKKGFSVFMSSKFHHGHENYKGYALLTNEKIEESKLDPKKYSAGQIVALDDRGEITDSVKVYDISLT